MQESRSTTMYPYSMVIEFQIFGQSLEVSALLCQRQTSHFSYKLEITNKPNPKCGMIKERCKVGGYFISSNYIPTWTSVFCVPREQQLKFATEKGCKPKQYCLPGTRRKIGQDLNTFFPLGWQRAHKPHRAEPAIQSATFQRDPNMSYVIVTTRPLVAKTLQPSGAISIGV